MNWQAEVAIIDSNGAVRESGKFDWNLPSILPAEPVKREAKIEAELRENEFVALRVLNPMNGGLPLRFANENQQLAGDAWLILK